MLELFFEPEFDALRMYETLTPTQRGVSVPHSLRNYIEGLERFLGLDLSIDYCDFKVSELRTELDTRTALLLLSGGVDSTHTLMTHKKHYDKIIAVFVRGLNPSISTREERAVQNICEQLGVPLEIVVHHRDLHRLHRNDPILVEEKGVGTLLESQIKNQYAMLLCLDIIEKYRCGTFLIQMDYEDDPDDEEDECYSDTKFAYQSFSEHFEKITGGCKISFSIEMKKEKIRYLIEKNMFDELWFCYMSQLYFKAQQNRTNPPFSNMCGACFKCKRYLKIFDKYKLI